MTTWTGAITTIRTMHQRTSTTACTCGRLRCPELAVLESTPLTPTEIAQGQYITHNEPLRVNNYAQTAHARITADRDAAIHRILEHLDSGEDG